MAGDDRNTIRVRADRDAALDVEEQQELDAQDARHEKAALVTLGLLTALFIVLAFILPTAMFTEDNGQMTLSIFLERITGNISGLLNVFVGNGSEFEMRFMVVVICAVSGAALGLCGSAYQGAFNNPLAAPKTLGVMGGGALGSLIYVVFLSKLGPQMPTANNSYTAQQYVDWLNSLNPLEWLWTSYGAALCSVLGCCLIVTVVVALTSLLGRGKLSNIIVIIFGQVFAASVTAIISFSRYWFSMNGDIDTADALKAIENYTMAKTFFFQDLLVVVLPIVICMVIVLSMSRRMTLLSFGDDEAAAMGVNVNRSRYAMIAVCTVMTALAISFCGHVAFLGFISAHLARRIVGPNFKYLLPASMLTGASLLTVVQYICQSGLPYTSANAAGVVCSILGALIFLAIVIAQWRKGGSGEWR